MTIETKFNINDLVQQKFQRGSIGDHILAYEIIEIKAVNCYTTAQIFYVCRSLHAIVDFDFKEKKKMVKDIVSGRYINMEYSQFREDELKYCSDETKNIILNTENVDK